MKKVYKIAEDAPLASPVLDRQEEQVVAGEEVELELSQAEEKAMIAAGWISEPKPDKSAKGGKG